MSRIKVDRITDKAGTGAPILVNGMNVTGKSTMGDIVGAAATFNSITGGSANFSSNVSIGGTLTYEDVKNVDSVGLITARSGINITGGALDLGDGNINNVGEIALDKIKPDNGADVTLNMGTDKNMSLRGNIGEIGSVTGFQAVNDSQSALTDFGIRATTIRFATGSAERLRIGSAGQIGIGGANYGTSGHVLTSGGASAAPQWAEAGGGAWEVVSTQVLSGSTQYIDYNGWSNAYQKYQLVFNDVYYDHNNFNIYLRIYQDATSGNTGTLKTASSYAANCFTSETTSNSGNGGWTGWVDYHKLGNNSAVPVWHGTYEWYMEQPVSTPSGNNEAVWGGTNLMERQIGINDSCIYAADKSEYITGIRVYFFDQGSAISPTGGRFTLYRMKYS